MNRAISILIFLYIVALHCSIAAMEMLSWSIALLTVIDRVQTKKSLKPVLLWPLTALLFCVAIGLSINPAYKPFMAQFGFMRWVVLFWIFIWSLEKVWSEKFERELVLVWFAACSILAVYGSVQFLTGLDLRPGNHVLEHEKNLYRAAGFFVNCLTFAYVMGASYFALPSIWKLPKRYALPFLIVGFFAIVGSMSRGALLGAMITAFFYIAVVKRKWLPAFVGGAAVSIGALSLVWGKLGALLHFSLDTSSSERLRLWTSYFHMFLDHPLFGVGLLQGDKFLPEYYARLGFQDTFYSHAHNVWIQWLGGAGSLAFLLFLFVTGAMLKWAWQLRSRTAWGWSLLLAHIFVLIGGMTEANFFDGEVNHILVWTWAMTAYLHRSKT